MSTPNHIAPTATLGRVLAVDDETVPRRLLELHLRSLGYEVVLASDVSSAKLCLDPVQRLQVDCVITDYLMPGESGMVLLEWLKHEDPTLATVLLTVGSERQIVVDALRAGASNFIEKPYRRADLANAVAAAVAITAKRRRHSTAEADAIAIGQIQRHLQKASSGTLASGVTYCHHPRHGAGGDFINVFPLDDDRLIVLLADVSGHDLQAAFVSAYFQGIARGMLEKGTEVGEILEFFNRYLIREWNTVSDAGHMTTSLAVCATIIDRNSGDVTVFSAGAPPPQVIGFDHPRPAADQGGGNPLGWFEDSAPAPVTFQLEPQGGLVMWTDGLEDHALDLGVSPHSLAFCLLRAGRDSTAGCALTEAKDDILAVRIGMAVNRRVRFHTLLHEHYQGSRTREIDLLQERWHRSLKLALPKLEEGRLLEILICTREACLNAMLHGCECSPDKLAEVSLIYETGADRLHVAICDPGPGHEFDWQGHVAEAIESLIDEHRGLSLIHGFANTVQSLRNGACLHLQFELTSSPTQDFRL